MQQQFPVSPQSKVLSKNKINFNLLNTSSNTSLINPQLTLNLTPTPTTLPPQPVVYRDTEQIELMRQILQAVSAKPRSDTAEHTANFGVSSTSLE